MIVHDHRMQIRGRAVAAQDDHVVQLGIGHAHAALHQVVDHRLALTRHTQADRRRHASGCVRRIAIAPGAVIPGRAPLGGGALAHGAQFLGAAVATIGVAAGQQRLGHLGMAGGASRLEQRLLVRRKPEPGQALEDHVHRLLGVALAVRVLDAQQVLAAVVAGKQVVEQRGADAADVQKAGGAGGEAGADLHGGRVLGRLGGMSHPPQTPRHS